MSRTTSGCSSPRDSFYATRPELMMRMVGYGVLAVEMEASALYTLAAKYGRRALAICTVSDHVVTGEETTSQERERTFGDDGRDRPRAAVSSAEPGRAQPGRQHSASQLGSRRRQVVGLDRARRCARSGTRRGTCSRGTPASSAQASR